MTTEQKNKVIQILETRILEMKGDLLKRMGRPGAAFSEENDEIRKGIAELKDQVQTIKLTF